MEIQKYCVQQDVTLRVAMKQLDLTGKRIIFVLDGQKLLGCLTDGDIRRFLLRGLGLEENVMGCTNTKCTTAFSFAEAKSLLQAKRSFSCIPIINDEGCLVDLYFREPGKEPIKHKLELPVVIMAGGKGARLEPYTKVLPKALVPVGELPIVEHIMSQFQRYGCTDFHMIVNHKKQLIKAYFSESASEYIVHFYDEDIPLGTGGGLYMLKGSVDQTFFLTNCDILIDADYSDILNFHREQGNAITMICAYRNIAIPYGVIEIGKNGAIQSMQEKPEFSFLTNTGMYLVEPSVLDSIPEGKEMGFPDIIDNQIALGRKVAVFPVRESCWMDMGQMDELNKMRGKLYGESV